MQKNLIGDLFGGLASMLVALPSAIAFGILVYSPLGPSFAGAGALAGIVGTITIGIIAAAFGGRPGLVSAPCAPAAAVLSAFVAQLMTRPSGPAIPPEAVPLLVAIAALLAGTLQFAFGALGGGRLIKYIPYPVIAGYLSGVGILIIFGQLPKLLGLGKGVTLIESLAAPSLMNVPAITVGAVAAAVMIFAPKITKTIPAPILALGGAIAAYFGMATIFPELNVLEGNPLVVGSLGGDSGGILETFGQRWDAMGSLSGELLKFIFVPGMTLAVLLSIDTLKTCVIVDALTRSRHNSNRELIGQGLGNAVAALGGGVPGAGTMGATLVNISSGGKTRLSGILTGFFSLATFALFGKWVAWVPFSALAGILIVVGFRMIDRSTFKLLRKKSTILDFVVVAAVVLTAVFANLIAAAGVGLGLAIALFLREQAGRSVVRRKSFGNQVFSKKRRLPTEMEVLARKGEETVIFELQNALFFGTTDQLFTEVEPYLSKARFVIFDLKRVQSVDFSGTHLLKQIESRIADRKGSLLLSNVAGLKEYFDQLGLLHPEKSVKIFDELGDALEWAEDQILEESAERAKDEEVRLMLSDIDLLKGMSEEALQALASCTEERTVSAGSKVFGQGEAGDEIYLIRRGCVRIVLPINGNKAHHLATFGQGDFFGDIAFLDKGVRSANAIAVVDTDLYVISRARFNAVARAKPILSGEIFERLSYVLASRLRQTDAELRVLEEA